MSTKQPEALRLAAALDELFGYRSINTDIGKVATELRRLHAMNEQLSWVNDSLETVNKELLEALQLCEGKIKSLLESSGYAEVHGEWFDVVQAAIAKATGDKA
jgi:hypothetical protein